MPTYEYACGACGHQWEQVQRIVDPPLDVCPQCAKPEAYRLISGGTNFILKGGGWYSDLYSSSKPAPKAAESTGESKPATAEGAKSETKSETKAETKAAPAATSTTTPSTPSSAPSSS